MALILLAFVGNLAIFFRIWRELDGVRRSLDEVRTNQQYYAVDAAQQNRDLAALIRELRNGARQGADSGGDCLGELLERGISNLSPAPSAGRILPDIVSGAGIPDEDEDFLRRFEKERSKGTAT